MQVNRCIKRKIHNFCSRARDESFLPSLLTKFCIVRAPLQKVSWSSEQEQHKLRATSCRGFPKCPKPIPMDCKPSGSLAGWELSWTASRSTRTYIRRSQRNRSSKAEIACVTETELLAKVTNSFDWNILPEKLRLDYPLPLRQIRGFCPLCL